MGLDLHLAGLLVLLCHIQTKAEWWKSFLVLLCSLVVWSILAVPCQVFSRGKPSGPFCCTFNELKRAACNTNQPMLHAQDHLFPQLAAGGWAGRAQCLCPSGLQGRRYLQMENPGDEVSWGGSSAETLIIHCWLEILSAAGPELLGMGEIKELWKAGDEGNLEKTIYFKASSRIFWLEILFMKYITIIKMFYYKYYVRDVCKFFYLCQVKRDTKIVMLWGIF